MDISQALKTMERAAVNAGRMLIGVQSRSRRLVSDKDFLTKDDMQAEALILMVLEERYPDIPVLSEEKGGKELREGYLWIVDPIDGTINFFRGDSHWGVSIALVHQGQTVAGVVYLPARQKVFSAVRESHLARRHPPESKDSLYTDLKVRLGEEMPDAQFWVGWGKERRGGEDHEKVYEVLRKLDRCSQYPQIRNSAVADMMSVAQGRTTGYIFPNPDSYDIAAAGLIVEMAGAVVTDMEGQPWTPFSRSLVVCPPMLYQELLRVLNG